MGTCTPFVTWLIGTSVSGQRGNMFLKNAPAYAAMQTAHAIYGAAAPQCKQRHAERLRCILRVLPAQRHETRHWNVQRILRIVPEVQFNQFRGKPVETRLYWRVRCEEVAGPVTVSAASNDTFVSSM